MKELAEHLSQDMKTKAGLVDGLIEELFQKFLFQVPSVFQGSSSLPKCKTKVARTAAFALLIELIRGAIIIYLFTIVFLIVSLLYNRIC